jgi:DNA-directed RNA polymerase subunit RPC12/RpoP
MVIAKCIACNQDIILASNSRKWTYVTCQHCGRRLEIIQLNPALLDWPLSEVEDYWDDHYDTHHETMG